MSDGMAMEKRVTSLQTEIQRLWQALRRLEPSFVASGVALDGRSAVKQCRICGAVTDDIETGITHGEGCPFAALAFPIGVEGNDGRNES